MDSDVLQNELRAGYVRVPLIEIQRWRDELARKRHYHEVIRRLHGQVAGLYQRLAAQMPEQQQKVIE